MREMREPKQRKFLNDIYLFQVVYFIQSIGLLLFLPWSM